MGHANLTWPTRRHKEHSLAPRCQVTVLPGRRAAGSLHSQNFASRVAMQAVSYAAGSPRCLVDVRPGSYAAGSMRCQIVAQPGRSLAGLPRSRVAAQPDFRVVAQQPEGCRTAGPG